MSVFLEVIDCTKIPFRWYRTCQGGQRGRSEIQRERLKGRRGPCPTKMKGLRRLDQSPESVYEKEDRLL